MKNKLHAAFIGLAFIGLAMGVNVAILASSTADNLIVNGNFQQGGDGTAPGWRFVVDEADQSLRRGVGTDGQSGESFLYIAADRADAHAKARWLQRVPVHPAQSYEFSFKARCAVDNSEADRVISVATYFTDAQGKGIPGGTSTFIAQHQKQWPAAAIDDITEWQTFRRDFIPPPGAREMVVQLSFRVDGSAGRVQLTDVSLTATTQTVKQELARFPETLPVYAVEPEPVKFGDIEVTPDWDLDGAASRTSRCRSEICLNAFFAVQPGRLGGIPAEDDWAYSKIPGSVWERSLSGDGHRYGMGPTAIYGMQTVTWSNINQTPRASDGIWYLRNIPVESAPRDAHVWRVVFDNLKYYVGRLYLNGRFIADLEPGRNVADVSSAIRPGETNQFLLFCLPVRAEKEYAHEVWAGTRPRIYDSMPGKASAGSTYHFAQVATLDSILLQRLPADPVFDRVRVIPSWRNKTLTFELPAADAAAGRLSELSYELTVRSADGQALAFDNAVPDHITGEGETLRLTYAWPDPQPWSAADPYLYTYTLNARDSAGNLIDETLPERFGFREIWIEGRDLMLNGRPLYLRPSFTLPLHTLPGTDDLRRHFAFLKDMGFNTLKLWAEGGLSTMEVRFPAGDIYRLADEMGLYAVVYTPYRMVSGGQFNEETADASSNLLAYIDEHLIRVVENHPSVIAYSGFGKGWHDGINYLQYRPDIWGAAKIGDWAAFTNAFPDYSADHADQAAELKNVLEQSVSFIEGVKAKDPGRPFLSHHDIGQGDAWSVYSYFNWTPRQEWEDWPKDWSRHGVMPIGSGEGGLPFLTSFANHGIPDGDLEPWFAEYAAMVMGDEAYRLVSETYLERIRASYGRFAPAFGTRTLSNEYTDDPIHQRTVADFFIPRLYRSWRTYGVPLGMEPFGYPTKILPKEVLTAHHRAVLARADDPVASGDFYPDRAISTVGGGSYANFTMPYLSVEPTGERPEGLMPIGAALRENNSPFLGWIVGPAENFTAKDHVFQSGETVQKQLALIWDAHRPLKLRVTWRLERDGTVIDGDDISVELAPAEHRMIPISFRVETDAAREDLTLALDVCDADGRPVARDSFALQVYGARALPFVPEGLTAVALDPRGEAERFLREIGVRSIQSCETAAAFREAVAAHSGDGLALAVVAPGALPLLLSAPAAEEDGLDDLPLLVLEQRVDALEAFGFRAYPVRQRRAFTLEPDHPVLRDMTPAEWSDWRVAPTLLGEGPEPVRKGYNYRTGTGGTVASVEIETPATGCFTPLLSCGFDLNSSPLLELDTGRRRIVFCQLSLTEGIASEPAARRLAENLIAYLAPDDPKRRTATRFRSTALLGDEADRTFFEQLGLSFAGAAADGVIVVGKTNASPKDVLERVRAGATAVLFPAAIERDADEWANLTGAVLQNRSLYIQPQAVLAGKPALAHLGQNSLHFRQAIPVWTADGAVLNVTETGRGRIVWIGFDPRNLDIETAPWLRLTQRRMVRTIAQILNNVDADFSPFAASFEDYMAGRGGAALLELPQDSILLAGSEIEAADGDWRDPDYDDRNWIPFPVDRLYTGRNPAYLRVAFELPANWPTNRDAMFDLGTFDDYDEAWLNGERIGGVTPDNSTPQTAWSTRRLYRVPSSLLNPGRTHVLAIKTWKTNPDQDAIVRATFRLESLDSMKSGLYWGVYRISDDPYLQRHW